MAAQSDASHGDSPRPKLRPNLEGVGVGDPGGAEGDGVGGTERGFLGGFTSVEG